MRRVYFSVGMINDFEYKAESLDYTAGSNDYEVRTFGEKVSSYIDKILAECRSNLEKIHNDYQFVVSKRNFASTKITNLKRELETEKGQSQETRNEAKISSLVSEINAFQKLEEYLYKAERRCETAEQNEKRNVDALNERRDRILRRIENMQKEYTAFRHKISSLNVRLVRTKHYASDAVRALAQAGEGDYSDSSIVAIRDIDEIIRYSRALSESKKRLTTSRLGSKKNLAEYVDSITDAVSSASEGVMNEIYDDTNDFTSYLDKVSDRLSSAYDELDDYYTSV